jgi:hypothetical protein
MDELDHVPGPSPLLGRRRSQTPEVGGELYLEVGRIGGEEFGGYVERACEGLERRGAWNCESNLELTDRRRAETATGKVRGVSSERSLGQPS